MTNEWRRRAACADQDPELFFPVGVTEVALLQIEQAKAVCRRCPVMDDCLQWATQRSERGIWGGLTEGERRDWARRSRRKQAAEAAA